MGSGKQEGTSKYHCMVVHAYYPLGETRVKREALALIDNGYEVDVICLRLEGEQAIGEQYGVNIYRVPMQRRRGRGLFFQLLEYVSFFILAFVQLMRLYRKKRYRTIQVHNPPDFLIFTALITKLMGARLILDLHDLMPEFYADKVNSGLDSWPVRIVKWQEKFACRAAAQVITVTDIWKDALIRRGIPAEKVNVVMNVADPRLFNRAAESREDSRNDSCFKLIYHGTFTYRYGLDLMIQALEEVRAAIPNIHLTLLGNGDARDSLLKMVDELDLEKHVYFSPQSHLLEALPALIRQADVGIIANRNDIFTDGLLPTKMMEYVALGIPVIAARTSTISAYFDDTMVQFFQPSNANSLAQSILTLYNDPSRRAELAANSDKFNKVYRWDSIATSYVALVDALNEGG